MHVAFQGFATTFEIGEETFRSCSIDPGIDQCFEVATTARHGGGCCRCLVSLTPSTIRGARRDSLPRILTVAFAVNGRGVPSSVKAFPGRWACRAFSPLEQRFRSNCRRCCLRRCFENGMPAIGVKSRSGQSANQVHHGWWGPRSRGVAEVPGSSITWELGLS